MSDGKLNPANMMMWVSMSIEPIPEFKADNSGAFVKYGADNDYPARLLELFDRSTFHGAICLGKADYIAGSGIDYNKELPANELAILEKFISRPNRFQSLQEVMYQDALNLVLFNGIAHKCAWWTNKKGFNLYASDFCNVRTSKDGSTLYISEKWKGKNKPDNKTETYKAYNSANREGTQLKYSYVKRPGKLYYPVPEYLQAIEAIIIDYLFTNFHKNNIENGFSAGTFMELPYGEDWTGDQKAAFESKLKKKASGTDQAGGILLSFLNASIQRETKITPMQPNNLDKQFTVIDDSMQQRIFTGHRITSPMLFGIKTEGQLGGRTEILDSYELFHSTYVSRRQQYLEAIYNQYARDLGVSDPQIRIKKSQPIGLDLMALADKQLISRPFITKYIADQMGVSIEDISEQVTETDKNKKILDAINSVSPLIANKIIESLTDDEMRGLVGLPPNTSQLEQPAPQKMSSQEAEGCDISQWKDDDWKVFMQFGEDEAGFELVPFTFAIQQKEIEVLTLIKNNPKATQSEIAYLLKLDIDEAVKILDKLRAEKYLILPDSGGGNMVVTPNGELAIEEYGGKFTNIEVRYKYAKSPAAEGDTLLPTSREFCREMVKMNKIYTREDIDKISTILGYDVWKRRGGWYTVKNSNPAIHVPHCRHVWEQKVVRRRIN